MGFDLKTVYYLVLFFSFCYALIFGIQKGLKRQNYIFVYLLITFLVDFVLQIKIILYNLSSFNGAYYKAYAIFCIIFFCWFYYYSLSVKQRRFLLATTAFAVFYSLYIIDFRNNVVEPGLGIILSFHYIFISLNWFYYKIQKAEEKKLVDYPYFWISSGLLIWGGFFLFRIIPAKYFFENDPEFNYILKTINFIISTIMYCLFSMAIFKFRQHESASV